MAANEKSSCSFSSIVRSSKNYWQELLIFMSQIAGKVFNDFSRVFFPWPMKEDFLAN